MSSKVENWLRKRTPVTGYVKPWYQHVARCISLVLVFGYAFAMVAFLLADYLFYGGYAGSQALQPSFLLTWIPAGILCGDICHGIDREVNGNVLELTPAMQVPAEVQQ